MTVLLVLKILNQKQTARSLKQDQNTQKVKENALRYLLDNNKKESIKSTHFQWKITH